MSRTMNNNSIKSASLAAPTAASLEHKPILAERFKTKMCQNYEKTGVCPYETRCMFAHGEGDLRTKEMNLADNLVTEEAIKQFQRARALADKSHDRKKSKQQKGTNAPISAARKEAAKKEKEVAAAIKNVKKGDDSIRGSFASIITPQARPAVPSDHPSHDEQLNGSFVSSIPDTVPALKSPEASTASSAFTTPVKNGGAPASRRYRHDPYAPVVIAEYIEEPWLASRGTTPGVSPLALAMSRHPSELAMLPCAATEHHAYLQSHQVLLA